MANEVKYGRIWRRSATWSLDRLPARPVLWIRITLMRIRMQIRIRLIALMRIRILIFNWCGSVSVSSPWYGSESRSQLPKKAITLENGLTLALNFGLSSANWCGSGSGFLFDTDPVPDADPGYQNDADPDPQQLGKTMIVEGGILVGTALSRSGTGSAISWS